MDELWAIFFGRHNKSSLQIGISSQEYVNL